MWTLSANNNVQCCSKLVKVEFHALKNGLISFGCMDMCMVGVATPVWGKCEDETRTPKSGNLESSGTPKTSKLDCKGQNTLPWSVFYTVGKVLKCRCRKWPRMSHSNIISTSYGRKKGRESNWQFDSRPLKVGNRPDPTPVCAGGVQHTVGKLLRRATSLL